MLPDACVPFQNLGQVLRERRAGHYDIGAGFLRFLLQLTLHMGKIPDQADVPQIAVALQLCDQLQWLNRIVIEIQDDQERLVLRGFVHNVLLGLDKFGLEPRAFSGIADLHRKQKVVHYSQDLLLPVVVHSLN